jgi:hypothetical protein
MRGALASGLSLATLLACYAGALLAGPSLGTPLGRALGIPPLLAGVAAATAAFLGILVALAIVGSLLRRREKQRRERRPRPAWDRLGGASFGAARGALIVVLLGWLAHWLDAAVQLQQPARPAVTADSKVGALARQVVESGAERALGRSKPGAKLAARVLARPAETLTELRSVLEHPAVGALATDQIFWEMVQFDAVERALHRPSFTGVANDANLRSRLAAVGVVEEADARNPAAFRRATQQVLEDLGPRLRRLRQNPELQRLANDPEVVSLLERGDVLALLQHPGFQQVVSRTLAENGEPR